MMREPLIINLPAKSIRAKVIADYIRSTRGQYLAAVCFSCGNASTALKATGLPVDAVLPGDSLLENDRWWHPWEIASYWPRHYFDATPGHLPAFLMARIASEFRKHVGDIPFTYKPLEVPTGSGETILCLRMAYPDRKFVPISRGDAATHQDPRAPLLAAALQQL